MDKMLAILEIQDSQRLTSLILNLVRKISKQKLLMQKVMHRKKQSLEKKRE